MLFMLVHVCWATELFTATFSKYPAGKEVVACLNDYFGADYACLNIAEQDARLLSHYKGLELAKLLDNLQLNKTKFRRYLCIKQDSKFVHLIFKFNYLNNSHPIVVEYDIVFVIYNNYVNNIGTTTKTVFYGTPQAKGQAE
jgi:hypothetical protein